MSLARTLAPIFVGAVILVLVAVGVLAARLMQGPIPLPALTERFERALSELSPDLVAHVAGTELAWAGGLPELRVVDVKVSRRTGEPIAVLPALAVRPSLRALAHGQLAVRRIEVSGLHLSFVRDEQGRVLLGAIEGGPSPATPIEIRGFLETESEGGSTTQYLKRVVVHDGQVVFEDKAAGGVLRIGDADGEVVRHGHLFDLTMAADVSVATPRAAALREVKGRMSIEATISPPAGAGLPSLTATLKTSGGTIIPGGDAGPSLPIRSLVAEARFEASSMAFELTRLSAAIGSASIEGSGSAKLSDAGWDFVTHGEVRSFAVAELRRFWPATAAIGAREWVVKNIPEGTVSKCRYSIHLPAEAPPAGAPTDPIDVRFDYQGLVIHYFGELDPVREVRGTGVITSQGLEGSVTSAELGDLHLAHGSVDIRFHTAPARLATSADLTGPTASILTELGRPPLDIPAKIGIAANNFGGSAAAHVDVQVPLHTGVQGSEVKWTGNATLTDATVANVVGSVGIEGGKLDVHVEGKQVQIEGNTAVTGVEGVTGPAHLALRFDPDEGGSHLKVALEGTDVDAEGTATFGTDSLRALSVARLRFGRSDVSGEIIDRQDGGYHVSLSGESIDLEPLVRGDKTAKNFADSVTASYDGEFSVKKVFLGHDVELVDVSGTGEGKGSRIERLEAAGTFPGGGPLDINLAPREGSRRLRVRSQNAGRVLKALGVFADAEGGHLTFIARFPDGPEKKPTEGVISVRDFRVIRAPVLARILSAGSLTGIADLLQGEGIAFSRLRIPFRFAEDKIDVSDAGAVGAMGLTAEGSVDRAKRKIDVRGRVIPAYTLNSALGKIPYVGDFLVGGKGEGVFGIEYHVSGALDHPDVDVNPLSALAPGALRKLFVDPFRQSDEEPATPAAK